MEIDFLGLTSPNYKLEQEKNRKIPFVDAAGGVEISLSLSTSSSLNFSELQQKKWEFAASDKMISPSCSGSTVCSLVPYNQENSHMTEQPSVLLVAPPFFRHSAAASAGGFLYDLNDTATTNLRNMSQLSAENLDYISGNASTGYTPTVAMARRATLARFLEKRLHRMNQARASPLMGNSLSATNSEACETTITRNNKKRTNSLKKR